MWFKELYQRYLGRPATTSKSRPTAARRRGVRLTVEQLEDRMLPSNFTAASVSELIADINAANLAGGANTITLQARHTFTLTKADNTTYDYWGTPIDANGLPVITANDNLTIVGNGDTIQRSQGNSVPAFRLFEVDVGASLTLKHLKLKGGLANDQGGAVYNQGTLDLNGVTVQNNTVWGYPGLGGGVYSSGVLTVEGGTLFQNNQALGDSLPFDQGGSGFGGALYVGGGTATLTSATVSGNTAQGGDGGPGHWTTVCVLRGPKTGPLHRYCYRVWVAGGPGSGMGGGIYIASAATVYLDAFTQSHITNNTASTSDPNIHGPWTPI